MFHVQVTGSLINNYALDHALLYCIGVNLPKHSVGQLDRVLVLASPVNDVNLYAWSLDRVKRFMTIEAGIQMELCPSCMGKHHKKIITFLLSPDFREDCMAFLLRELRVIDEPQQFMEHGPFVYNVPHQCGSITSQSSRLYANTFPGTSGPAPPPYCNDAELAVFQDQKMGRETVTLHPRAYSNVSTRTNYSIQSDNSVSVNTPPLPPRDIARPNYENHQSFATTEQHVPQPYLKWRTKVRKSRSNDEDRPLFETPYHISHRIYITDNGIIRKESQVFGSGSGEFRKRRHPYPPTVPPRNITDTCSDNPIYIQDNELLPGPPRNSPQPPTRPDFIGRRPPVLPPRGVLDPTFCTKAQSGQSISESDDEPNPNQPRSRYWSEPTIFECNNFEEPPTDSSCNPPPLPPRKNLSFDSHYMNVDSGRSTPSLCTDDVTNADFELMTRVTFTNILQPSYLPPRSNRQPVPVPRSRSRKDPSWALSYTPTPPSRSPPSPPPPFRSPPARSPPPPFRSPSPTHIEPITEPPHFSFNTVDDNPLMSTEPTATIPLNSQPLAELPPTQYSVINEENKSREQPDHFEWTMNTSHSKNNSPSFRRNIERFRSHSSGSLSSGSDDYAKYKHRSNEC